MIAYFDTSAIVPLLVQEPSSGRCERAWLDASRVHIAAITVAETAAALAQAKRISRIDDCERDIALRNADDLWRRCAITPISLDLARDAARLAVRHDLRGFYAVQCATGLLLAEAGTVGVAGDRALLEAWRTSGLPVIDVAG